MRYINRSYWLLFALFASLTFSKALADVNDIYKVTHIGQGNSLTLHAYPADHSRIVVSIPHNASWVIKRQKRSQRQIEGELWHKVVWAGHEGWVKDKYLSKDVLSTRRAQEHQNARQQCLKDNTIKDKSCCGYTKAKSKSRFKSPSTTKRIDMYAIKGVAKGSTVSLRSQPGKRKGVVLVAVPHSAKWIAALPKVKTLANGETWQQVRWGAKTGWMNKKYLQFDDSATLQSEKRRTQCK